MAWTHYCCETCERFRSCGNDCGSCSDVPPDAIVVVHGPFVPNVALIRESLARHYPEPTEPSSLDTEGTDK